MNGKLNGRVALVTGAASGIGRSTALAFADEGAKIVVADVLADQGRETVDLIETPGGEAIYVPADVSRPVDVERLVKTTVDTFGRLVVVIAELTAHSRMHWLMPSSRYPTQLGRHLARTSTEHRPHRPHHMW